MKHPVLLHPLIGAALAAFATVFASAEEVTVHSILIAHRAGATADGIVAVVNDPSNTIAATAADTATLRAAGVSESVILAVEARAAAPIVPLQPDDPRLVDLVRLIKSGISESIVAEQVKQTDRAFDLSVQDLLYLKQNGVLESTIGALMATGAGTRGVPNVAAGATAAAPAELTFDDLEYLSPGFLKKSRLGRLVLRGDTLAWVDGGDPKENFEFQIAGLEKVWFTCQTRTPENFCYQLNFKIVKGDRYQFRDMNRESGSNASVLEVMEALRKYFPQVAFGPPDATKS
jgi:hypothetical protein